MLNAELSTSRHEGLLETLKRYGFLADYHLAFYCPDDRGEAPRSAGWQLCEAKEGALLCGRICAPAIDKASKEAAAANRPTVFRCPVGLLGFAVPLPLSPAPLHCLVGGGVREKSLDLYRIEALARDENINPFALLEQLQHLPITTEKIVEETAERAHLLVASLLGEKSAHPPKREITEKLNAVAAVSADMDRAKTAADAVSLLSEAIGILFDIPAIAVVLPDKEGTGFSLQGTWGFPAIPASITADMLKKRLSPQGPTGKVVLTREEIGALFPELRARCATSFPFTANDELLGVVVIFNRELADEDVPLVEILTGRAAARVVAIRREEEYARASCLSEKLLTMISSLAETEGKEELYRRILEMGADIVHASCGSLMLVNESREALRVESAIGINPQLARVMSVKLGNGIAGRVAMSGRPMLVNDIEKDERVAALNRPRFKTKSFISIPLMFKGEALGVLNLSDKKNRGIFTKDDLDILTPFVSHASSLIQRTGSLERVELLERLSITDPLTELYNRRFLEKRMEEELNRSVRNGLPLTVMLMDLDNFKIYNDICGHIAGDRALKKGAKILRRSVREMDVVTRYGGEEFCVLLPGASKKESTFVAERIRRGIENETFPGEEHLPQGRLTTSIGISSFPEDGSTATALINSSDIALYQAKSQGRNRIVIFESTESTETGKFSLQLPQ